jgi:hypothetical protein
MFSLENGGSMFLFFNPEDGDSMFLRNVGIYLLVHTALQPTKPTSTWWDLRSHRRQYFVLSRFYRIVQSTVTKGHGTYLRSQVTRQWSLPVTFLISTLRSLWRANPQFRWKKKLKQTKPGKLFTELQNILEFWNSEENQVKRFHNTSEKKNDILHSNLRSQFLLISSM